MRLKWMLVSIYLEIVLIMMQDRCMVYAEHTTGSKSFWTPLIEFFADVGHVESHFSLFGEKC
jgi:hypothetical protein